jgi:hypothetical protein
MGLKTFYKQLMVIAALINGWLWSCLCNGLGLGNVVLASQHFKLTAVIAVRLSVILAAVSCV